MFKILEKDVFHRIGDKGKSVSAHSRDLRHRSYHSSRRDTESCHQSSRSRETKFAFEKHHNKRASSRRTESLLESEGSAGGHWKSKPKNQKSSVEDDLRLLTRNAGQCQRGAICSITRLLEMPENGLIPPAEKYIKDPVEIHNIKQRDGESTKEFVRRGKVAASNRERKKSFLSWKQQEARHKQNFKKGGFRNQQRTKRKQDRFTLLTKTPKEILALDKGKFKPPPPMTIP
ncbi:hypothetical protein Tco_1388224, partial [Tanacetum coccineum]